MLYSQNIEHKHTQIDANKYQSMYKSSISNPDYFWAQQAKEFIHWEKTWDRVSNVDYEKGKIAWFEGAKLNVSYNCLDRHLKDRANQIAIIWEGDNPKDSESITYKDLYKRVCKFANGLKSIGVKKGDRVCLYMPMIVESCVAMLACARIAAIHSVVFAGFSKESIKNRILDSQCKVVITADEGIRGGKKIPLKVNVDNAVDECDCVDNCSLHSV